MFAILLSTANALLAFVLRSVIVKFVLYFGLFFVVTEFMQILSPMLPNANGLSGALGGIPADVWYFLDLFNVTAGIPMLLSAWVTRFVIRRLPIIG
jgi:hypothetical protein